MRSRVLLLVTCVNCLNFSPRRLHLQRLFSRRWKLKRKEPTTMLRNQDRPELLLFVTTNAARWTDGSARPGVERLVAEAADAGTPSLWICEDDTKPVGDLKPTPWPNAPALPCPQALQDARAAVEVHRESRVEAARTISCDPRRRLSLQGGLPGGPPPQQNGSRDGRVAGRNRRCKGCIKRCRAHSAARPARGARACEA